MLPWSAGETFTGRGSESVLAVFSNVVESLLIKANVFTHHTGHGFSYLYDKIVTQVLLALCS
jgi:hypothetical protein